MALFANDDGKTVDAWEALAGKRYQCLECTAFLKVRKTKSRFPHFYHLKAAPSCRLYSKSKEHFRIQLEIQKQIPAAALEKQFPAIRRIADVAWEEKRVVFEIQCSAISEEEARAREEEYRSVGYEVVWVLDDRMFNKRRVRPAEAFLRGRSCYFVRGESWFYDQLEIFVEERRVKRSGPMPVRFSEIRAARGASWPAVLPPLVRERAQRSQVYFTGDVLHRALAADLGYWVRLEKQRARSRGRAIQNVFRYLCRVYLSFLNQLLSC